MTPNGELGFCLKEIKEVTRLSILVEIYEEYFPIENELAAEFKEFKALFFQVLVLFEHLKEGRPCPKTHEWYYEWFRGTRGNQTFLMATIFTEKSEKRGPQPITYLTSTSIVARIS